MIELKSVYRENGSFRFLYTLLSLRPSTAHINHKEMPTWCQHLAYVKSKPYDHWYLIDTGGQWAGSIYLDSNDEIGVDIHPDHQRSGYATQAILSVLDRHPRHRYIVEINPANEPSIALFRKLGFECAGDTHWILRAPVISGRNITEINRNKDLRQKVWVGH